MAPARTSAPGVPARDGHPGSISVPMSLFEKTYSDLDRALDELRSLEDTWSESRENRAPDAETIHSASLVLHEWIANLHQYADFKSRTPTVQIRVSVEDRDVVCSVVDNSEGFNLEGHLPVEPEETRPLPERGMGLRIIQSCTESLSYNTTEEGLQRFEFIIPADHDPWLNTLF